jgi:hypothetical protein
VGELVDWNLGTKCRSGISARLGVEDVESRAL